MKLNDNDLYLLSRLAVSAACQAGRLISEYTHQNVSVKNKTAGDSLASQVITEVDLLSQEIILNTLLPTCEMYDLALLSEETPDDRSRLDKDFFWCIDPLDGTLSFVEGTSGYAVSIALVSRSGEPYMGVIFDPVGQTLYSAVKGEGALRNSKAWTIEESSSNRKQSLTLIFDRSFLKHEFFNQVAAEFEKIALEKGLKGVNIIRHGGAAMNACWVIEKQPACYFKFPKTEAGGGSLWDYAASACIFKELGAVVADISGHYLEFNPAETTYMNNSGILYASDLDLAERIVDLYGRIDSCNNNIMP